MAGGEGEPLGTVAEVSAVEADQPGKRDPSPLRVELGLSVEVGARRRPELGVQKLGVVGQYRRAGPGAAVEREVDPGVNRRRRRMQPRIATPKRPPQPAPFWG